MHLNDYLSSKLICRCYLPIANLLDPTCSQFKLVHMDFKAIIGISNDEKTEDAHKRPKTNIYLTI